MMWGYLIHLSYNMWHDRKTSPPRPNWLTAQPYLRFDDGLWSELIAAMRDAGVTTVVIDLGDAVRYESHAEIAVRDAWAVDRLRRELNRLRDAGLEPIPKMNFSASLDVWLGPYARQVSTDLYYRVCSDLIGEAIDLFDRPRLFHLGMDEETADYQRLCEYVVVRQYDLWWHDFLFLADQVQGRGVRPWIWSDYVWRHSDEFFERMPKNVLQSNWWYDERLDPEVPEVRAYIELAERGYEQVPTGSNYKSPANFEATIAFAREHLPAERVLGFLQTVWKPTLPECRADHMAALDQIRRARSTWEKG